MAPCTSTYPVKVMKSSQSRCCLLIQAAELSFIPLLVYFITLLHVLNSTPSDGLSIMHIAY